MAQKLRILNAQDSCMSKKRIKLEATQVLEYFESNGVLFGALTEHWSGDTPALCYHHVTHQRVRRESSPIYHPPTCVNLHK